jgi:hypothetical protein
MRSREHTGVTQYVKPPWRYGRCKPTEQAQRIHVDRDGAVGERALEFDADESAFEQMESLLRKRGPQDVFAEGFLAHQTREVVGDGLLTPPRFRAPRSGPLIRNQVCP